MSDKTVIVNIEKRVRQLIDDHKRLSRLCRDLEREREKLRNENRSLRARVKSLDTELAKRELCEGLEGSGHNREKARARVNHLMREVDKCIALVGQSVERPDDDKDA